jgi:hypothetical protein
MDSKIAEAIGLKNNPVAIIWSDTAPEGALHFRPGRWGCVVSLFAAVATKGRPAVFDRSTYGCWGGGVGLGFGNCYEVFPGGVPGFCGFLADGNDKTEAGRQIGQGLMQAGAKELADDFLFGERYLKTAETTQRFLPALNMRDIPARYVVVKPLSAVASNEEGIKNITFFVEADALSALVTLANHTRPEIENVGIPYAAGCQVMALLSYREIEREHPRALVGLTDVSARKNTRGSLVRTTMSFTMPWSMFLEMEGNVEGSFLRRETWRFLQRGNGAI